MILYNAVENCFSGVAALGHYILYHNAKYSFTYIDQPQQHFNVVADLGPVGCEVGPWIGFVPVLPADP